MSRRVPHTACPQMPSCCLTPIMHAGRHASQGQVCHVPTMAKVTYQNSLNGNLHMDKRPKVHAHEMFTHLKLMAEGVGKAPGWGW